MFYQNQTTSSRKTTVYLDKALPVIVNAPWGLVLNGNGIGNPSNSILFSEAYGWQITPKQLDSSKLHELEESNNVVIKSQADGGTLKVVSGIKSRYAHRKPSELTGILTGINPDVAETSDYLLSRTVAANTSWVSGNLSLEQSSFPGIDIPASGNIEQKQSWNYQLLRIAEDTVQQKGFQPFSFKFLLTGTKLNQKDVVFVLYFCGPPSKEKHWTGSGRYALAFMGNGKMELWERKFSKTTAAEDPYSWRKVRNLDHNYSAPSQVVGNLHQVVIVPQHGYDNQTKLNTGDHKLTIYVTNTDLSDNFFNKISLIGGLQKNREITIPVELNPENTDQIAVEPAPFRVSTNAALRAEFQLSYLSYPTSGSMETVNFTIPTSIQSTDSITVNMYGDYPSSTDIEAELFTPASSGWSFPMTSSTASENCLSQTFSLTGVPSGENTFYLKLNFTGTAYTDPSHKKVFTPKLRKLHITKQGLSASSPTSGFSLDWPTVVENISFEGPTADPSQESADLTVKDLSNQHPKLLLRGEFPISICTEYEEAIDFAAEPDRRSVLFQGYATKVRAKRVGSGIKNLDGTTPSFPAQDWREYSLSCQGEYKRLVESLSTFNWDFSIDPETNEIEPPFVVNIVKYILNWAGYDSTQIDFGDGTSADPTTYPIRLFPRGTSTEATTIQAGTDWGSFLKALCRDYLGAALVFCPNSYVASGTGQEEQPDYSLVKGAWRLIHPQSAPYTNLIHFTSDPPNTGASGVVSVHSLSAYGADASGIRYVPYFKDSLESEVSPPEVNKVVVTGTGELSPTPLKDVNQLTKFCINTLSYDFLGEASSDDEHPDFIGRERVGYKVDPIAINTPEAATWVLRRTYDIAAHALKYVTFIAPLVLVKPEADTALLRHRPLRFYDPILIDNVQFLVRAVSVQYTKDGHQLARYECVSPPPAYLVPGLGL